MSVHPMVVNGVLLGFSCWQMGQKQKNGGNALRSRVYSRLTSNSTISESCTGISVLLRRWRCRLAPREVLSCLTQEMLLFATLEAPYSSFGIVQYWSLIPSLTSSQPTLQIPNVLPGMLRAGKAHRASFRNGLFAGQQHRAEMATRFRFL